MWDVFIDWITLRSNRFASMRARISDIAQEIQEEIAEHTHTKEMLTYHERRGAQLESDLAHANDSIIHWRGMYEREHEALVESQKDSLHATRTLADYLAQQRFGHSIFNTAPDISADSPNPPGMPSRGVQGRDRVRAAQLKTAAEMSTLFRPE